MLKRSMINGVRTFKNGVIPMQQTLVKVYTLEKGID